MQLCLTPLLPPSSPHLSPPSLLTSLPQRVSGSGVMLHPSGSTVTSPTSHLIPHPPFHWTSSWPYDLEVLFFFFFITKIRYQWKMTFTVPSSHPSRQSSSDPRFRLQGSPFSATASAPQGHLCGPQDKDIIGGV